MDGNVFQDTYYGNNVHVLIQLPNGQQYVVLDSHFGKSAKMTIFEKKPDRAAMRALKKLDMKIQVSDFEIDNPRGLGQKNCYFAVWFPSMDKFQECEAHWHDDILPVNQVKGISPGKKKALALICQKAQKLHEIRAQAVKKK